jgi:hypothetical protein
MGGGPAGLGGGGGAPRRCAAGPSVSRLAASATSPSLRDGEDFPK